MIEDSVTIGLILSAFRFASPLALAAIAGMFSERAGLAQIALEGLMLIGAFTGAVSAFYFQCGSAGLLLAIAAGMFMASGYAILTIHYRANQIVSGTVINMLSWGGIPVMSKFLFDSTAQTPTLSLAARNPSWIAIVIAGAVVASAWYVMTHTRFGLWLSFAGEKPEALRAAGISVVKVRWQAVLLTGAIAGVSGALLSTSLSSSYTRNMVAGRGFMALAALILGKWRPVSALLSCLLFGALEVAQLKMQSTEIPLVGVIPAQMVQMIPYVVTLLLIAGALGESKAPKALGAPD